jgi:hypothetical protein
LLTIPFHTSYAQRVAPNPPFQPTAAREIVGILVLLYAARLRRLMRNPFGGSIKSGATRLLVNALSSHN